MRLRSAPIEKTRPPRQNRKTGMTDTQALLGKIAALRQRLEQAQGLAREAGTAAAVLSGHSRPNPDRIWRLERHVVAGGDDASALDGALRQLSELTDNPQADGPLPHQLTARARRILEGAREVLHQLRSLAEAFESVS